MTIINRLLCTVDHEPQGFHAPGTNGFAVNLNIETVVETEEARGTEAAIAAGSGAIETFLTAVKTVRFFVYSIAPGAGGAVTLSRVGPLDGPLAAGGEEGRHIREPSDESSALVDWLKSRATASVDPTSGVMTFWAIAEPVASSSGVVEIEGGRLAATHLLRAAQAWDAPVGHRFGLTHLALLPTDLLPGGEPPVGVDHLLLPWFATDAPPETLDAVPTAQSPGSFDIVFHPGGAFADQELVCRTQPLRLDLKTHLGGAVTEDGYLIVDKDADLVRRLLVWFEERAVGLLSPYTVLTSIESSTGDMFDVVWDNEGTEKVQLFAPEAAWLAVTGLAGLLDPLIIGLCRPASDVVDDNGLVSASEGQVLSVLVNAVVEQVQASVPPVNSAVADGFSPAVILSALRRDRAAVPLLDPTNRPAFVQALRTLHGLKDAKGQPPQVVLLDTLLKIYEQLDPSHGLTMKRATAERITATMGKDGLPIGLCMPVLEALQPFQQALADEKGAESAILRYLTMLFGEKGGALGDALIAAYEKVSPIPIGDAGETIRKAASAAWTDFCETLNSDFNGGEALRRSASVDLSASWLKVLKDPSPEPTAQHLASAFEAAALVRNRILPKELHGFADILGYLPRPEPFGRIAEGGTACPALEDFLAQKDADVVRALEALMTDTARFVPDAVPQPLTIALSADYSGHAFDAFAADFNGIGVLIRRMDDAASPWSHANLAELTYSPQPTVDAEGNPAEPVPDIARALHPSMPALSDGHAPLFQLYEGMPFATAGMAVVNDEPFYRHDATTHAAAGDVFAPVPKLAYGRGFESLAFVTTNAGTLPAALRADPPWMPKARPFDGPVTLPQSVEATTPCQRRTAIGAVSLHECDSLGRPVTAARMLGVTPPGVQPLAHDYPRIGAMATATAPGVIDLFRANDGTGQLRPLVNGAGILELNVTLSMLRWHGSGQVLLRLITDPRGAADSAADLAHATLTFDLTEKEQPDEADLTLHLLWQPATPAQAPGWRLSGQLGERQPSEKEIIFQTPDAEAAFWLRLETPLQTSGSALTLSLADPRQGETADRGDRPLVLLAPSGGGASKTVWNSAVSRVFHGTIVAPRIGYADFERWFANGDLRPADKGHDEACDTLLQVLALADRLRDADPKILQALAHLPDPAVSRLRIEIIITDQLTPTVGFKPVEGFVDVEQVFKELWRQKAKSVEGATELVKCLTDIDELFSFRLDVKALSSGQTMPTINIKGKTIEVHLPQGLVAEIRVQPAVKQSHFAERKPHPSVFHERMRELAQRPTTDGLYLFAATAIQVETVYDVFENADKVSWSSMTKTACVCRPAEHARAYDLVSNGASLDRHQHDRWRGVGEIDVMTQRWRDTGRPIYAMLNPQAGQSLSAAVEITHEDYGTFEKEIFFARAAFDAETVTKRLDPAPATTLLQQIIWDAPSATYLRHRFLLRSRYAGVALLSAARTLRTWQDPDWSLRMAILADYGRLTLTRPQVRALLPLTQAPLVRGKGSQTPPVAVFLQERPYAHGGLADRIAAELKTSFGYAFDSTDLLGVEDARKEIGSDPRLSYSPLPHDAAFGLALAVEGPAGLTFDNPANPAASLANSVHLLTPVSATQAELPPLEEHFAGLSLRRYVDPAWIVGGRAIQTTDLDPDLCWWIDWVAFEPVSAHEGVPDKDMKIQPLLSIDGQPVLYCLAGPPEGSHLYSLAVPSLLLDPKGSRALKDPVELARFDKGRVETISVLHQALAPGRFSSSVFVRFRHGEFDADAGRNAQPVMLCSFEWAAPPSAVPAPSGLVASHAHSVSRCLASAPTPIAWVRTGRDFDKIAVHPLDRHHPDVAGRMLDVTDVAALLPADNPNSLRFLHRTDAGSPLWLTGSTTHTAYPLHVHRHLAVIGTRLSEDIGRAAELFSGAVRLNGTFADLAKVAAPFQRVRIVEFETPAAILCASQDVAAVPATYKSAYFDLLSRGPMKRILQLHIRLVGPPAHLRQLTSLSLDLRTPEEERRPDAAPSPSLASINLPLSLPDGAFAVGVRVTITPGEGEKGGRVSAELIAEALGSDGSLGAPVPALISWRSQMQGFVLKLTATAGGSEVWADVSLLTGDRHPDLFDFDWIFSQASDLSYDRATKPAALSQMTEAQARIVAVSPPIDVVKGTIS